MFFYFLILAIFLKVKGQSQDQGQNQGQGQRRFGRRQGRTDADRGKSKVKGILPYYFSLYISVFGGPIKAIRFFSVDH